MLPGSLSEQWHVCGTPVCKCRVARNPVHHGPHYQSSFSVMGRSSTLLVRRKEFSEVDRTIQSNQRFKGLFMEVTQGYVDPARKQGLARRLR